MANYREVKHDTEITSTR